MLALATYAFTALESIHSDALKRSMPIDNSTKLIILITSVVSMVILYIEFSIMSIERRIFI